MPLLEGKSADELATRALYFQRNRYAPTRHVNAAIRSGRWKLYWPGDEASLRKDAGRDNPSYRRGVVHPHWEMPLDRQLDDPKAGRQPAPRLFDLEADPAEKNDIAAAHPEIVQSLARQHDAWFGGVAAEWRTSREQIIAHDIAYWRGRPIPDPAALFRDFWQWQAAGKSVDPKASDPLRVFRGYWSDASIGP